jgi:two-component system sensor histidine kinase YesM
MLESGKKGRRSLALTLKRHLAAMAVLFLFSLLLAACRPQLMGAAVLLLSAVLTLLFLLCMISLARQVYGPMKKVEDLTDILTRGDNNLFPGLDLEEDGTDLSMNFQELLHQLKASVDREVTADMLKKEAELKALQSQINPHFLYNVLDGIRGHALSEGVVELAEMTEALSRIFRYSVSHWENEVTLESELVNAKSYFKIQQYRFNNRFDLRIVIEESEDETLACRLPKLTLQPIIENSIYHGLETKLDRGLVTIRTRLTDRHLLLEIGDDGAGCSQEILEKVNQGFEDWKTIRTEKKRSTGTGIALANVNSRIKMMYGEEFGLHMYSTEGFGAMIEILLPRSPALSGESE